MQETSGARSFDPDAAVEALLAARNSGEPLDALPETGRPSNQIEAYAIQNAVARRLGPVVAWKVGAPAPDAVPSRAPIHANSVFSGIDDLRASQFRVVGIEAEIVFRFGRDLPQRERPWSRAEILDAVDSVHPAFETLDTRCRALGSLDPFSHLADQANHGALIVGLAASDGRALDFACEPVALEIDGQRMVEAVGGNSAGDPVRLLEWLANEGARDFGGLRAGDFVTTGSCSGTIFLKQGQRARATFGNLGSLALNIV